MAEDNATGKTEGNAGGNPGSKTPVVIKKYANRRLYNTASSSYVTLDDLCQMVKAGNDFQVLDAKSGDDITRQVLTQIIVEEEAKGQNLLPVAFLRQLIGFYGDSLQALLPRYLEQTMDSFSRNQEQMRHSMKDAFGGMFPFGRFEEMGRQNMAFFENAMKMFAPPHAGAENGAGDGGRGAKEKTGPDQDLGQLDSGALNALKSQLDTLQRQIETLTQRTTDKSR
jgi:polyhydroxyalkanoate synthesis repressor PhaR